MLTIGVPLIVHSRQKFQVTDEAKIVFEQARHIFKAIQDIHDKVSDPKEITGALNFVSTNSLGMSFLAPSYERMRTKYPGVNISFKLGNLQWIRSAQGYWHRFYS